MKKLWLLVLACSLMMAFAGLSVSAAVIDTNRQFEMEIQALRLVDGAANATVQGVRLFFYRDGVALTGSVVTDANGRAVVSTVNQGATFTVRFEAPEGFAVNTDRHGQVNRIEFVPVEQVGAELLNAEGVYEGVITKQIFFVAVETEEDEDDEDYNDYAVVVVSDEPILPVRLPETLPTPVAPAAPVPGVIQRDELPVWPVRLFAFAPAW